MYDGDVLGAQHLVDGLLLCRVQVGEVHGLEGKRLCLLPAIEQVAQIGQSSLAAHGTVQRLHHQPVARLVERQLHAYVLCPLHVNEGSVVRHGNDHAVAIHIAYHTRELEVVDTGLLGLSGLIRLFSIIQAEKHDRPSELKAVLNVCVRRAKHLHRQLVQ